MVSVGHHMGVDLTRARVHRLQLVGSSLGRGPASRWVLLAVKGYLERLMSR